MALRSCARRLALHSISTENRYLIHRSNCMIEKIFRASSADRELALLSRLTRHVDGSKFISMYNPYPLSADRGFSAGMSRFLLNIAKRSLPRLMLSGVGLANKVAV